MIDYKKKYLKYKLKYLNLKKNPKKNKLGFLKGGTIKELEAYLDSKNLNLKVHDVSGDGNCQFYAIIHQLDLHNINVNNLDNFSLRERTVEWLNENPDWLLLDDGGGTGELFTVKQKLLMDMNVLEDNNIDINKKPNEQWKEYIKKMKVDKCWGDSHTINAISIMLKINIIVYAADEIGDRIFKLDDTYPTITIGYVNKNHFVSLVSTKDTIKDEEDEESEADKEKTQVQELEKVLAKVNTDNVKNTGEILPLALEQIKKYEEENNNPIKKSLMSTKDDDSKDKKSFIEKEAEKLEKALEEIKLYQPSKTADVSTEDNDSKNNDSFAKTIAISALIVSLLLIFLNK